MIVQVAPVKHGAPDDLSAVLELPLAVKRHLEFDGDRPWVILDEVNKLAGADLRALPGLARSVRIWIFAADPASVSVSARCSVLPARQKGHLARPNMKYKRSANDRLMRTTDVSLALPAGPFEQESQCQPVADLHAVARGCHLRLGVQTNGSTVRGSARCPIQKWSTENQGS
jgi:hypothetical protein